MFMALSSCLKHCERSVKFSEEICACSFDRRTMRIIWWFDSRCHKVCDTGVYRSKPITKCKIM